MKSFIMSLLIATFFSFSTFANNVMMPQDTTTIDSSIVEKETPNESMIYQGQTVYFTLDEDIFANEIALGSTVDFIARVDLKINDKVFIEKGAIAEGEIIKIEMENRSMAGAIKVQLKSVQTVNGNIIEVQSKQEILRFNYDDEKGFIKKGKNMSGQLIAAQKKADNNVKEQPTIKIPENKKSTTTVRLYSGITIDMETKKTYKKEELKQGAMITLRVLSPVKLNNVLVVEYDAIAFAEVTQVTNSAFGNEFEIKLLEVTAIDGQRIPLRGTFEFEEKDFSKKIEMQGNIRNSMDIVLGNAK